MKRYVAISMGLVAGTFIAKSGMVRADESMSTMSNTVTSSTEQHTAVLPEVKLKDLNRHPEKFANQNVMVKGKVSRLEGANAFIVESKGLFSDKMLVVVAQPQQAGTAEVQPGGQQPAAKAPVIKEKQDVQLTGTVEDVDITKVEAKYGPMKSEVKEEFVGVMPVLVVPASGIKVVS